MEILWRWIYGVPARWIVATHLRSIFAAHTGGSYDPALNLYYLGMGNPSPDFNGDAGAVTLASDAHGVDGVISGSNSLVGAASGDQIGSGGITVLGNSNIVVLSPEFNNGAGAATFMPVPSNGGTPVTGVVSSTNSLVGSASGDEVGSGGVIQLSNGGNFLVLSPNWNNGAGAITNGDDFAGLNGVVSASNSLVGAAAGDHVGTGGSVTDRFPAPWANAEYEVILVSSKV